MIVFDGPVSPDDLTAFVREVPTPADQVLNRLLPDRYLNRNRIDIGELTKTNRTARFRAYDARLHVSKRDVVALKQVNLPPLSTSVGMGEYERLQLEFARTGGTNLSVLEDAIYDDATNLTREVKARMEQARGDVLTDGKFTLAGEGGLVMEADYGVPGSHIVTAGTPWSTIASATVVTDLLSWVDVYVATNGRAPGGMVVSRRVLNYMLRNAELRTLAASLAGTPNIVTRTGLDAALDTYGLPPILFVYDTKVDVDDVTTAVIPDDKVIMVPITPAQLGDDRNDLGYTAWGVSATSLELVNAADSDMGFEEAPGIVGVVDKSGPPYREHTYVDAVGMPVLENPKLLFVADVA